MKYLIIAIAFMICMACSNHGPQQFEDDKSHFISWSTGSCIGKLTIHYITYAAFYDATCDDSTKVFNITNFTVK